MEPSTAFSDEGSAFQRQLTRGIAAFLALAVVLRVVRTLQNFPLWCDETMLAANLLDRDWTELARPLDYRQVCPLGFLMLQWVVVRALGFTEVSLRLVPLVCAVASVPVFFCLARRVLGAGTAATFVAVAVFAVSEPLIRYAGEAKPYECDFLVTTVLLYLCVIWLRSSTSERGMWALAAAAPPALALSLPAVFPVTAVALVGLYRLVKRRTARAALAFGGFVTTAGLAVLALAAFGQYRVPPESRHYFVAYWADGFPPSWQQPAALARWLVRAHTGPLFSYPHGTNLGLAWLNPLVFGCFALGALLLWRKERRLGALLLLPVALTFVAAALKKYPYGMSARVTLCLVPSIVILAAAGAGWLWSRAGRFVSGRRILMALAILLAVLGTWRVLTDLGRPYRTPWDRTAREFARWFWEEMSADGELVCVRSDLGIPFRPGGWAYDGADQYLCYQRIYSRRHREGRAPRWDAISEKRPLRCVLVSRLPDQVPGFRKWIEEHKDRYQLKDVRTYPATRGSDVEPAISYVVCEFVPISPDIAASGASATTR